MDDFTKKELEKILEGLGRLPPKWNSKNKGWNSDLEIKIKSMIDNYCEHIETEGCIDCNSRICKKCNKREEDE